MKKEDNFFCVGSLLKRTYVNTSLFSNRGTGAKQTGLLYENDIVLVTWVDNRNSEIADIFVYVYGHGYGKGYLFCTLREFWKKLA